MFLIAICRQWSDKWQSKTLFLRIFHLLSSIVLMFSKNMNFCFLSQLKLNDYTVYSVLLLPNMYVNLLTLEMLNIFHVLHFSLIFTLLTRSIPVVSIDIFSIRVENSVDPDQMASDEAIWSGSTVLSKSINPRSAGQGLICYCNSLA